MTLLDSAKAQSNHASGESFIYTATRNAKPKMQGEILDLLAAAVAREVTYSAASKVLTEALGRKVSGEVLRKHSAGVLTEHGR